MPSYSIGFWVAATRNGSGSGRGRPSTETCRSSITSSSAAWVFGGVRLISSASSRLVKTGPSRNSNAAVRASKTSEPVTSLGMRSGVNCTRRVSSVQRGGERPDQQRLGHARHALEQHVPPAEQGDDQPRDDRVLAHDRLADLGPEPAEGVPGLGVGFGLAVAGGGVDLGGLGHGVPPWGCGGCATSYGVHERVQVGHRAGERLVVVGRVAVEQLADRQARASPYAAATASTKAVGRARPAGLAELAFPGRAGERLELRRSACAIAARPQGVSSVAARARAWCVEAPAAGHHLGRRDEHGQRLGDRWPSRRARATASSTATAAAEDQAGPQHGRERVDGGEAGVGPVRLAPAVLRQREVRPFAPRAGVVVSFAWTSTQITRPRRASRPVARAALPTSSMRSLRNGSVAPTTTISLSPCGTATSEPP